MNRTLELAVIIPCRNVAATVTEQLDALASQSWDGAWEVLVVDNGSTDQTRELALSHRGLHGRLRVIDAAEEVGVAAVRRKGVESTSAQSFVFCDGDDVVGDGWLAAFGAALRDHDFVTGATEVHRLNSPAIAVTRGTRSVHTPPQFGGYRIISGGNGGFRRQAWDRYGGFDENFTGLEDIELSLRIAGQSETICFVESAVLHYRYRSDLRELWQQGIFYGRSRVLLSRRCRQLGLKAPSRSGPLKSLIWLGLNLPRAMSRRVKPRWIWTLANRWGSLMATLNPNQHQKSSSGRNFKEDLFRFPKNSPPLQGSIDETTVFLPDETS